ncbi:MAG TPA: hypothetical protein VJT14_16535 [Candidatus Dormibacteraeota bacterium]|nr:hypothetical protein [Candidatus Dormibacteraeota bacterium]
MAAVLVLLLALLISYALWTVYENTLTPAALDQGPSINVTPSNESALSPTAARALKAYGGEAVWRDAVTVEGTVTVGGLLFQLKGINIPPHAKITVDVQRPHTVIDPVDQSGDSGVLDGFSVMILSPNGTILEQRADAREHLQNASVSTRWDRLNLVYFLGYAFWGYFSLPHQLLRTDIAWTELTDGLLQADFGTNLPVHSRIQRFWFDKKTGLLKRNDYTPEAASRDARAAHVIFEHGVSNGIPYAAKRRVKMSLGQYGWVLPFPDFITIDVEHWQLR